jgi:hypothetical protein
MRKGQTNFYLLVFYAAHSLVFCVVIYKSLFTANKEAIHGEEYFTLCDNDVG